MIARNFAQPLVLLCLLVAAYASPALSAASTPATQPSRWLTSLDSAVDAAREGNRYLLVDLYADWCGWCKVLEKEVFTSPEFRELTQDMVLLRVDTEDGGEGTELQGRFGASGLPTTLILDQNLVKVGAVKGYAPTAEFITRVQNQIEAFDSKLELYDQVRRDNNVARMRQLAEDFHGRGDGKRAADLYDALLVSVSNEDPASARLHYLAADAHRLSGDFATATTRLQRASQLAADQGKTELGERLDMLRYYIAFDRGDCGEATASLEQFLDRHPHSGLRSQARRTLDAVRRGESMECT